VVNPAWDNNTFFQARLLRALPDRCELVLDVGCGKGAFAIRLAELAGLVDAVDRSAAMIEAARQVVPGNVTCQLGDVAEMPLPAGAYDAITSISALHHMSLPIVLPRLAQAQRPALPAGGTPLPAGNVPPDDCRAFDARNGPPADHPRGAAAGGTRTARSDRQAPAAAAVNFAGRSRSGDGPGPG